MSHMKSVVNFNIRNEKFSAGTIVKVTQNGEISFDADTKEFIVYQECYSSEVGRTQFPLVAIAMLETYAKEYL